MTNSTITEARNYLRKELKELYPDRELQSLIKIVLQYSCKIPPTDILAYPEKELDPDAWHKINKICHDLKEYKPIQYILGTTEFYGLTFDVNEYTLIPRQETEELVDLVIKENTFTDPAVLDIGTGSGAIAISLSKMIKGSKVTASDISEAALKTAKINADNNTCTIDFIRDDILNTGLQKLPLFDIIVSNPPYIMESEREYMHRNVLDYEPGTALFVSNDNPLLFYKAIAEISGSLLRDKGRIYCEINEALGKETARLFESYRYNNIRIIKDINNKDRIISAIK